MKLQFLVLLLYYITVIYAQYHTRGVAKRATVYRKKDINGPKCVLNETITNDYEILSSAVSESKYVFTARVLSVRKIKRAGNKHNVKVFMVYKLYVRLVMKGSVDELKSHVFSGDEHTLNGAIVFVDWLRTNKCAYKLYRHSSGIFLSDDFYEVSKKGNKRLRLLNEPLPLSLYDLDRVNAALKGKCLQSQSVGLYEFEA